MNYRYDIAYDVSGLEKIKKMFKMEVMNDRYFIFIMVVQSISLF